MEFEIHEHFHRIERKLQDTVRELRSLESTINQAYYKSGSGSKLGLEASGRSKYRKSGFNYVEESALRQRPVQYENSMESPYTVSLRSWDKCNLKDSAYHWPRKSLAFEVEEETKSKSACHSRVWNCNPVESVDDFLVRHRRQLLELADTVDNVEKELWDTRYRVSSYI